MSEEARWTPEINEELFELLDKHPQIPSEILSNPVSINIKRDKATEEVISAKVTKPEGIVTPEELLGRVSRYLVLYEMGVGDNMEGTRRKISRRSLLLDMARTYNDEDKLVKKIIYQRDVDKEALKIVDLMTAEELEEEKIYEFEKTRNELYSVAGRHGVGAVLFRGIYDEAEPDIDYENIENEEELEKAIEAALATEHLDK